MSNQGIERKLDLIIHLLENLPLKLAQEMACRKEIDEYYRKEEEIKKIKNER